MHVMLCSLGDTKLLQVSHALVDSGFAPSQPCPIVQPIYFVSLNSKGSKEKEGGPCLFTPTLQVHNPMPVPLPGHAGVLWRLGYCEYIIIS